MNLPSLRRSLPRFGLIQLFALGLLQSAHAGSAAWNLNPTSGDWNTAANWMPNTVPNGTADVATFAVSNNTAVSLSSDTTVDSIVFSPGANAFTIAAIYPPTLTLSGAGVINNSGVTQNFVGEAIGIGVKGMLAFKGSASAGDLCAYTAGVATDINFFDQATAASSTFIVTGQTGSAPGRLYFYNDSTAAAGTFVVNGAAFLGGIGGEIYFHDNASAGEANLTTQAGKGNQGHSGLIYFMANAGAGNCIITNEGVSGGGFNSGLTAFLGSSTAANAHITNKGSRKGFTQGGHTSIAEAGASAGNAVITNEGGMVPNALGASTAFSFGSAGNATLINTGGTALGALGGSTSFLGTSDGGTAQVILSGNGSLDISPHSGRLTLGSVEGEGVVLLGRNNLAIGSNNLTTALAAVIQDGGYSGGDGGSLTKIGTGTLTLSGANLYTGATRVSGGVLIIANTAGSGTGTGAVTTSAGTLGGSGTIAGAVTIGTGAFLAPAGGTRTQATLSVQGSLNLSGNSTYTCTFKAKKQQAKTDKVVANGVTINGSASFNLSGQTQGTLTQGLVLTIISNTSATPIAGTFSNLPDGAILNVNGNNLQASYSGGDGNDLTLTVVL